MSEKLATRNMSLVLEALERVTTADARAKHAELRRVRRAFTLRNDDHVTSSSAPSEGSVANRSAQEWILREACAQCGRSPNALAGDRECAARREQERASTGQTPEGALRGRRHSGISKETNS